jgi:transposase
LGKAIAWFHNHHSRLARFCEVEGAKLDNNEMARALKIVVRDRNNVLFHKTLHGAILGDVITSMIRTSSRAEVNVFDYFTVLQQNKDKVRANPENYLPWDYQENS